MPTIIDTNHDSSTRLPQLRAAGIDTIIRYYMRGSSSKVIRRAEAQALAAAGFRLGIVYEGAGDRLVSFSEDIGYRDAAHCRQYGRSEIGQPAGSAVYFAVDADFSAAQIKSNIIPYFRGVAHAFGEDNGLPRYRTGVYGSGAVCQAIADAGLAELTWVSCSTGWSGSKAFLASGRWNLRQYLPKMIAGLDCDPDEANPQKSDIGVFVPSAQPASAPKLHTVTARPGLRLRSGPGLDHEVTRVLAFGAKVTTGAKSGDWVMVDVENDGAFDGYVFGPFLSPAV